MSDFLPPGVYEDVTSRFVKNSVSMLVSREMMLAHGLVDPTPEEAAERAESALRRAAEVRAAWETYEAARPALAAITEPLSRSVLDLHHPDSFEGPRCTGCDFDGYEGEMPAWPCRTVQAVAEHHGIPLPASDDIWRRPDASQP